MADSLESG